MNYMYPVYIFLGNVVLWPMTVLVSAFMKVSRFLAFATMAVIAGLVMANPFVYGFLMGHVLIAVYGYLIVGLVVAIVVAVDMLVGHSDLPEVFYVLVDMALGVFVGIAVGWII